MSAFQEPQLEIDLQVQWPWNCLNNTKARTYFR